MLRVDTILAIETSVPQASIALWSDGNWLFKAAFTSDRNHNSTVFNPLAVTAVSGSGSPPHKEWQSHEAARWQG